MSSWYEIVSAEESLTQGDFIFDCPVPTWKNEDLDITGKDEEEVLKASHEFISADVIVMTQACDLEQNKIQNVTLCRISHYPNTKKIGKFQCLPTTKI